ncbi:TLC domain-containing protein [Infundibulicybe gibba]|nr:TLC domain-containing protein [Infundibulicybe gibba]
MASESSKTRARPNPTKVSTGRIEDDPNHHLTGPFLPQTPLGSLTPERSNSPVSANGRVYKRRVSPWLRWAIRPSSSIQILIIPLVLYANWEFLAPYLAPGVPNPFRGFFLISHHIPTSSSDDPRYSKGYYDLVFIAYNIVFFSLFRQVVTVKISRRVARYFGIKKEAKLERFGEQGYALVYFAIFGAWGSRIMTQLPTWWYRTDRFWIDYPHWQMMPELKRYYLMQLAYWCQQLLVLVLGLEKPRKDYWELVAHHIVTLWLVGWSYFMNFTLIGNAVFMSMDIPDTFLAFSKLLNYIQWERAKVVSFVVFIGVWTYFRHYLNLVILWSVRAEFSLAPDFAKQWNSKLGVYMPRWMQDQIFLALGLLQLLNVFWYYLIVRIAVRAVVTSKTEDERSDDEDDGKDD